MAPVILTGTRLPMAGRSGGFFRAVRLDQHQAIYFRRVTVRTPHRNAVIEAFHQHIQRLPDKVWLIWSEMVCWSSISL